MAHILFLQPVTKKELRKYRDPMATAGNDQLNFVLSSTKRFSKVVSRRSSSSNRSKSEKRVAPSASTNRIMDPRLRKTPERTAPPRSAFFYFIRLIS